VTPQRALEAELRGLEESLLVPGIRKSAAMTLAPDVALLTYKLRRHSEPVVDIAGFR
jgi:hypothetical protein